MRSGTASPGRYTNTGRAAYVPVTTQRQVPAVLRVRHPSDSVHRQSVGHATETGIRSATVRVAGSVHSCFLADEVAAALVVDIDSCMFRAGFACEYAIRAVLPLIGDRPKIFGIMVDMDQKDCVSLRSSFVFQRNAWFGSGYNLRSSTDFFVFQRNAWFDSWIHMSCSSSCWQWHGFWRFAGYDDFALCSLGRRQARGVFTGAIAATVPAASLPAGMWGRLFGSLCIGTGPGVMSTGT